MSYLKKIPRVVEFYDVIRSIHASQTLYVGGVLEFTMWELLSMNIKGSKVVLI